MKKISVLMLFTAMLLSCNKEAIQNHGTDTPAGQAVAEMSFSASIDITKAILNDDRSVSFSAGDEIAVFANGNKYKLTTAEGGATATFTGTCETADTYYALFPYSEDATISGGTISGVKLGTAEIVSAPGTFAPKHAIFVGKSTGGNFTLKSVVALLKLTVPASVTDLKEVAIFSRENTSLSASITGTFDVTPGDGAPAVTVTAKNGDDNTPHTTGIVAEAFLAPGNYYIPVLPATLTKGIDMKLTYEDGTTDRPANADAITFVSGKVYDLGSIRKVGGHVLFSFEKMETDWLKDKDNNIGGGNESSLSVADNPLVNDINSSARVMKVDMTTRPDGSGTSGVVKLKNIKHMPSGWFRTFFNAIQIKIYTAGDVYYPQGTIDADLGKGYKDIKPNRVNGITVTNQTEFNAAYKPDDWNVLEWDYSAINNGVAFTNTNKQGMSNIQFRFFRKDWANNNAARPDYQLLCYVDDIILLI